jgi:hypothetical protein
LLALRTCGLGLLALLFAAVPAAARTIVLTDEDCERLAFISGQAPKLSWAGYEIQPGVFTNQYYLTFPRDRALLICFPIDRIPKDQKVTKAELVIPVNYLDGAQRLYLRRIVGDWGTGVCWKYRTQRPEKKEWAKPGAEDTKADAVAGPTIKLSGPLRGLSEQVVNVTDDVELWYSGSATNHGWRIHADPDGGYPFYVLSPISNYPMGRGTWKLRITYEPAE